MNLLNDTARCLGHDCDRRDQCERFRQREQNGPHTPFYAHMCGIDDFIIEVQEDDRRPPTNRLD